MRKTSLTGSVSVVALITMASAASAQQTPPAPTQTADNTAIEEVTVTGIRSALDKALDIKRNADGVVDAVSA